MILRKFFRRDADKERQEKYLSEQQRKLEVEEESNEEEISDFVEKVKNHKMVPYPVKAFGVKLSQKFYFWNEETNQNSYNSRIRHS